MRLKLLAFVILCMTVEGYAAVSTYNIAPLARVTATAEIPGNEASLVVDGLVRIAGKGEWVSGVKETFWGEIDFPHIRLDWERPVTVDKVLIYDRVSASSHCAGLTLKFSDGMRVEVHEIPADGSPAEVCVGGLTTDFLKVEITDGTGDDIGLSEIEVYPTPDSCGDYVSMVNPFIETTRGRYFFFITGCQPQGMIGAAPMTRNKNQGGGGYNYNDNVILGFPQIHAWMLSGLTFMPATKGVDLSDKTGWKSRFSHKGEIARPGYHRIFLEDYDVWVEQTASQRTSFYRMIYTKDTEAQLVLNLGGFVGNCTMTDAQVTAVSDKRLEGSFTTCGRLWGGPDDVKVFFVAEFDRAVARYDSWGEDGIKRDVRAFQTTTKAVPRNEGMSYSDAPEGGIVAVCPVKSGEALMVKFAISYVSVANAAENLQKESPEWDFDAIRTASECEWNEWLSAIDVKGGTLEQRVKFYTDLWHTLLGRHKINDINGEYPDRTTGGRVEGKSVIEPAFKVEQLPTTSDGSVKYNMYNSDALWLTQWNQNTLWGLAWPGLLDDFSASMLQYAGNGGLLPRGPSGGGYSFIMSGSPATSMITSAFQRGLSHKWDIIQAYDIMLRNHDKGGMMGHNDEREFEFYEQNGYAPGRAGLTVQWTFEDWALAQMARKLGCDNDADRLEQRSAGWRKCVHPSHKLLLPRKEDGEWVHEDPLSGWGYEEANAWQTTFGLSHDITGLIDAMGGQEEFCRMLNYAFEKSVEENFVSGYGNGYVSYANQPGLSNAHVFSYAGKPWLTQYWVRQVKDKAYGSVSPSSGYGGHDEDQGQMSGVSALMSIGLFSINGGSAVYPYYEITSPIFDEVTIRLDKDYYAGKEFRIVVHGNKPENHYIQKAALNGKDYKSFKLPHTLFAQGGTLELWLGSEPKKSWGTE